MCSIVCTIQDITSSLYDLKPPCLYHHTHYIGHRVHCICVITSSVLMISHQMYFGDNICYNSRHHIHCIQHDSHCMTSHHCIHHIRFPTYEITSMVYDFSSPIPGHHRHYVCEYMSTIFNIKHTVLRQYNHSIWNHNLHMCICVITHTVSMI